MPDTMSVRKGVSRHADARMAVAELRSAIEQPETRLVIFYCARSFDREVLASCMKQAFPDVCVIGCTTAGEITPEGYLGGTLTGVSFAGHELDVAATAIALNPIDSLAAGDAVDALVRGMGLRHGLPPNGTDTFAYVLADGMSMQEEALVSVTHSHLHGIELVGGSAGDDTEFGKTWVYWQGEFQREMAALVLVRTGHPFKVFRTQHFVHSDMRMVVTRADPASRRVFEINGLPAAPEYARLIGLDVAELTPLVFATHPVVVRIGGQYFVRSVAYVKEDDSLQFFCAIDEGVVLTIAKGVDLVENLRNAFADVRESIGNPMVVLGCDCLLRRLEIQRDGIEDQVGRIFRDNEVVGFTTYGEQINAMHVNQTFTGIAIGHA
ncbi:MAG: FIST N-terminal domain-containing protein [Burkholderiales bacterium]|nr:FIST N-terminal domain-containing protein [Burkholderiales bacterium]